MEPTTGFFEDELRGYGLLEAAALHNQERQQILTLTIGCPASSSHDVRRGLGAATTADTLGMVAGACQRGLLPPADAYWQEWNPDPYGDAKWACYGEEPPNDEAPPDEEARAGGEDDQALLEEEAAAESYALRRRKTLQQARDAVQKARQARGYYAFWVARLSCQRTAVRRLARAHRECAPHVVVQDTASSSAQTGAKDMDGGKFGFKGKGAKGPKAKGKGEMRWGTPLKLKFKFLQDHAVETVGSFKASGW